MASCHKKTQMTNLRQTCWCWIWKWLSVISYIFTTNLTDVFFRKRNRNFNENIPLYWNYSFQSHLRRSTGNIKKCDRHLIPLTPIDWMCRPQYTDVWNRATLKWITNSTLAKTSISGWDILDKHWKFWSEKNYPLGSHPEYDVSGIANDIPWRSFGHRFIARQFAGRFRSLCNISHHKIQWNQFH